jgi:hypothetical protein
VVQVCNPSNWEAEAGESKGAYIVRLCLKKKKTKRKKAQTNKQNQKA